MTDVDPDNEATYRVCEIKSDHREVRVPKAEILKELQAHHFGDKEIFAIKLALEEALANAVNHGNQGDSSKRIIVRYAVNSERAVMIVRDEGVGFSPDEVPDPTQPDRLSIPSGRGIMLIRAYMDEVEYRDEGREVYFVKLRH
ncbi:MAG: ATP-binding protein [Planctomycetota bacterium]|jgi:serine/threonine-protein kinase RsbW